MRLPLEVFLEYLSTAVAGSTELHSYMCLCVHAVTNYSDVLVVKHYHVRLRLHTHSTQKSVFHKQQNCDLTLSVEPQCICGRGLLSPLPGGMFAWFVCKKTVTISDQYHCVANVSQRVSEFFPNTSETSVDFQEMPTTVPEYQGEHRTLFEESQLSENRL